jgi:hypothetical protein
MAKRTACLRQLGGNRAGQIRFGRFLHNERVTRQEMLCTAADHTGRAARGRHVLAIQDTTELNFSGHEKSKRGFGVVGNRRDIGAFLHALIVKDAGVAGARQVGHGGGILGLADAFVSSRAKAPARKRGQPLRDRTCPIRQRESQRWLDGLDSAIRVLAPQATMVTVIADRESDIYDLFAAPRPAHVHLLVRAMHDRALDDGGRLFEEMARQPHAPGLPIEIPAKAGQPARSAATRVAWTTVTIKRPNRVYGTKELPDQLTLRAVRVEEVDPPPGVKPVMWLLLTTHEVETVADAQQILEWYRARWTIEQVFRTMKTHGFAIEESQIETPEVMSKLAIAVLIAALRVMQLIHARSGGTGQKLADAMDEAAEPLVEALVRKLEGKTAKLKCPHPPQTLARLAWVVGRLGGWDGYEGHGYKPAGPKTMALGLIQFDAIRTGWEMQKDV